MLLYFCWKWPWLGGCVINGVCKNGLKIPWYNIFGPYIECVLMNDIVSPKAQAELFPCFTLIFDYSRSRLSV